MYQSVSDAFTDFTKQYEGAVAWMYLDVESRRAPRGHDNLLVPHRATLCGASGATRNLSQTGRA